MERRLVLQGIGAGLLVGAGLAIGADPKKGPAVKNTAVEQLQSTWKSLLAKDAKVAADASPIVRSDDEWRKSLDPASYAVLRHEGTERPFSSPLNDEHRAGVFVCAGCALPLFTSAMKFDSGTGWPSYFTTIPGASQSKYGQQADPAAHRIPLREMRRPSRPRVRRRPRADRPSLLQ